MITTDSFSLPWDDQSIDASTALNTMIAAVPDYSTIQFTRGGSLFLQNPWEIKSRTGLKILGPCSIEELPQVQLVSANQADGTGVVQLESSGHCTLNGFWIKGKYSGVKIFNNGPVRISTNNEVRHNRITDLLNGTFRGIEIAPNQENNNEGMILEGNYIESNQAANSVGIYVGSTSENHFHYLFRNSIFNLATGITGDWSGYTCREGNFNANLVDIKIGNQSFPVLIEHCDTEGSRQHLVCGSAGQSSIILRAGRIAGSGAAGVGIIEIGSNPFSGPILIEGMDFQNFGATSGPGGSSNLGAYLYSLVGTNGGDVTLIANNYRNAIRQGLPTKNFLVASGISGALQVNMGLDPLGGILVGLSRSSGLFSWWNNLSTPEKIGVGFGASAATAGVLRVLGVI